MPEFEADLLACLLIKLTGKTMAVTSVDWCGVPSELLVTFTSIGCSKLMETFQPMFFQRFAGNAHGLLQKHGIAFFSL